MSKGKINFYKSHKPLAPGSVVIYINISLKPLVDKNHNHVFHSEPKTMSYMIFRVELQLARQVVSLEAKEKTPLVKYEEVSWNMFSSDSVEQNGEKEDR